MSTKTRGRHRAPRRYQFRPTIRPAVRASAVAVAAGGLVLSMGPAAGAAPVQAASATPSVAPTPTTVGVAGALSTAAPWHTVRYGARGAMVRRIQRIVGSYPDGVFGPRTLAAVRRWQARHGLVADGIVGPRTAAKMGLLGRAGGTAGSRAGRVIATAQRYTGIYYRYGGSTPAGFDCSGYTQFVYKKVGVNLPRTAGGQQARARRVAHPSPGDLVFFGSPAYHVGIYAGHGMMYDSGKPGLKTQKRRIFPGVSGYGRP